MIITRPPSLSGKYDHMYSGDDAFESDAEGFQEAYRLWMDSGEASHLEPFIKANQTPMRFTLQPLKIDAKQIIAKLIQDNPPEDEDEAISAPIVIIMCRLGLFGVTGMFQEDGKPIPFKRHKDSETKLKCVSPITMEWLAAVDSGTLVGELGMRVFGQAFAAQD